MKPVVQIQNRENETGQLAWKDLTINGVAVKAERSLEYYKRFCEYLNIPCVDVRYDYQDDLEMLEVVYHERKKVVVQDGDQFLTGVCIGHNKVFGGTVTEYGIRLDGYQEPELLLDTEYGIYFKR